MYTLKTALQPLHYSKSPIQDNSSLTIPKIAKKALFGV